MYLSRPVVLTNTGDLLTKLCTEFTSDFRLRHNTYDYIMHYIIYSTYNDCTVVRNNGSLEIYCASNDLSNIPNN